MDEVFAEERRNLATIEKRIDELIASKHDSAETLAARLKELWHSSNDYETIDSRKDLVQQIDKLNEEEKFFVERKPSPYFARLDFDLYKESAKEEKDLTYFIGKVGFFDDKRKEVVIDWRSPVAEFYYQKNQRKFSYNEYEYTLLLRRAFIIENAILKQYETEYDGETISLEGEVVDPFLLTVLKDKRRQIRLTDIIRTIQENQNEIIRKPASESFAVQGCAGSGKTMIMLHRLSTMIYNNRRMNLDNVKIITPNKSFDNHIDELSRELGLGQIERFSVDEYYVNLMNRYRNNGRPMPTVYSEKSLDEDVLQEVYSLEFQQRFEQSYHAYWDRHLSQLEALGLKSIVHRLGIELPDHYSNHDSRSYDLLNSIVLQVREIQNSSVAREQESETRRNLYAKSLVKVDQELDQQREQVEAARQIAMVKCETGKKDVLQYAAQADGAVKVKENESVELGKTVVNLQERLTKADENLKFLRAKRNIYTDYDRMGEVQADDIYYETIRNAVVQIINDIVNKKKSIDSYSALRSDKEKSLAQYSAEADSLSSLISSNYSFYVDYDRMVSLSDSDEIKKRLLNKLSEVITDIKNQETGFASLSIYNFARRNRLRQEIQQAKNAYSNKAKELLAAWSGEKRQRVVDTQFELTKMNREVSLLERQVEALRVQYSETAAVTYEALVGTVIKERDDLKSLYDRKKKDLDELTVTISKLRNQIRKWQSLDEAYDLALRLLNDNEPVDVNRFTLQQFERINDAVALYNDAQSELIKTERKKAQTQKNFDAADAELKHYQSMKISDEAMSAFGACAKVIDGLNLDNIITEVESALLAEAYSKRNQAFSIRVYRHKIYLRLYTYYLYFGQMRQTDTFLNIDEAQDISVAEYSLLSKITGDRCVYNLYGDVNQAVYSYKGIQAWEEDIPFICGTNVYLLNENYRNTIQITNYCNERFYVGMTPIGINGSEVKTLALSDAVQEMVKQKNETPEIRAAIIHRHGVQSIRNHLKELLGNEDVSWSSVDDKRISVISVEMAKGLEFESVIAVTDQMSENEMYVSFTRSLESLYIVDDVFTREKVLEDDDEVANNESMSSNVGEKDKDMNKETSKDSTETVNNKKKDLSETSVQMLFADKCYEPLVYTLISKGITNCEQLRDINLWSFMNQYRLYNIKERFAIRQSAEKLIQTLENSIDSIDYIIDDTVLDTPGESIHSSVSEEIPSAIDNEPVDENEAPIKEPFVADATDKIIEDTLIRADLTGCHFNEIQYTTQLGVTTLRDKLRKNPNVIEVSGRFLHKDALIDSEDAFNVLDAALEQLMNAQSFVTSIVLYGRVRFDLDMFMNDNSISGENGIYDLCQYLFDKIDYNGHHYWFYNGKISNHREDTGLTNIQIAINFARECDRPVTYDEILNLFTSNGLKTGNMKTQLGINIKPVFLIYRENEFILSEKVNFDMDAKNKIHDSLELAFSEGKHVIVLRDLNDLFYNSLPSLPYGLKWTPLILQQVLYYWGEEIGFRTISAIEGQDANIVHAFVVSNADSITTFPVALSIWFGQMGIVEQRYSNNELRLLIKQHGIIAGGELMFTLSKALSGDSHFAWNLAEDSVLVKGTIVE